MKIILPIVASMLIVACSAFPPRPESNLVEAPKLDVHRVGAKCCTSGDQSCCNQDKPTIVERTYEVTDCPKPIRTVIQSDSCNRCGTFPVTMSIRAQGNCGG